MAKRELQEINAGSMADIAFLLLIFFLVTTTMDSDTGLMRRLPAIPNPDEVIDEDQQIHERNILVVKVNKDNLLLVEGELITLAELRGVTRDFIENPLEGEDLPLKVDKEINHFGVVRVAENAVISLQNDVGTTYGVYLAVQNELIAARYELKNELALRTFGIPYDDFATDDTRRMAIDDYYKVPISEAEPRKIGE
jgi:biopolymer transport protein ExbD